MVIFDTKLNSKMQKSLLLQFVTPQIIHKCPGLYYKISQSESYFINVTELSSRSLTETSLSQRDSMNPDPNHIVPGRGDSHNVQSAEWCNDSIQKNHVYLKIK